MIPAEISNSDMIFGGNMKKLLPVYSQIPKEFKDMNGRNKWTNFIEDWFYTGLKELKVTPKEGIDAKKAMRHIKVVLGSWEPKHEHKIAGCAYLASQFFNDVQYKTSK